jgi:hypothetical protein
MRNVVSKNEKRLFFETRPELPGDVAHTDLYIFVPFLPLVRFRRSRFPPISLEKEEGVR